MAKKRTTSDFNVPGKVKFVERTTKPEKDLDWIEFACAEHETDVVMKAIGKAASLTSLKEVSAGTMLAQICDFYIRNK